MASDSGDLREALKAQIRAAFEDTPAPSPSQLRGSQEGDEPYLLEKEFLGKDDWTTLDVEFIDQAPAGFGTALSFFSRDAFRFYLPAYLLADLDDALEQAEPSFHLWHGLNDEKRDQPVNPRCYGPLTWFDVTAERCALFNRLEVAAIVEYLRYKATVDDFSRPQVEQALANFWVPRLRRLPRED